VKHSRAIPHPGYQTDEPLTRSQGLFAAWTRFWFTPTDPIGLHVLRIAAGLLFLAWLLPLAGNVDSLFGLQGWFDRQAYVEAARLENGAPKPISWSLLYLTRYSLTLFGYSLTLLTPLYFTAIGVFVLFTAGVWTRITSILTWAFVASFTANPALNPDADPFLLMLSLYLMVGYLLMAPAGENRSRLAWILGWSTPFRTSRRSPAKLESVRSPSVGANLALRLLQVHLAIVVVTSGLHKLQFGDWWAGNAFWYPLFPPFEATIAVARGFAPTSEFVMGVLSLTAYITLAWQIAFPLFAWRPRLRFLLLGGALLGWLGSAFLYGNPLVGPALFIGCLSYVTAAEWQRIFGLVNRIPFVNRSAQWLMVIPNDKGRIRKDPTKSAHPVTVGQP
jgi:hypothetical protein